MARTVGILRQNATLQNAMVRYGTIPEMEPEGRIYQLKVRVNRAEYLSLLAIAEMYNLGRNGSTSCAAAALATSAFAKVRRLHVPEALQALKPFQKGLRSSTKISRYGRKSSQAQL